MISMYGQPQLLQVILALRLPRGLPCHLYRRQEDRGEHSDDRDNHQQLDQRHRAASGPLNLGQPWLIVVVNSHRTSLR
jgi:hypothetical protein